MPFETQIVVAAVILVFGFFMVLVAWAERRAGGSFDDAPATAPAKAPAELPEETEELRPAA